MEEFRQIFFHLMNMFNVLIVAYFFIGNGIYTMLMVASLISVWLHNRRLAYQGLNELRESVVTPPVTIIMPAWNEQESIVQSVRSVLKTDYPEFEVLVVDDGSNDDTLPRLVAAFELVRMDLIYRPRLQTKALRGFYRNPQIPNLLVISKENGGKPDALNSGINCCRTPYFCTLDSDCLLERDALLRLMRPIIRSPINTVASGGIVRILNGCEVKDAQVVKVHLPQKRVEIYQVVEYLRSFLFGRTGWDLLGGTLIVSGAFAVFHRESVIDAGGFEHDTVTEDMDLIVQLHRWATHNKRRIRMSFTSDPVCWTECPADFKMLGRQRRRWQMGLCQTLWKHSEMLFNRKYGILGMLSFPFQLYVEGLLSVGGVLLEELTYRRYPSFHDLMMLLLYAITENVGYRQIVLYYRFQGLVRFITGFRKWEKVAHAGVS
ncbi:MAG: glycosyltransferase [Acidobacteriia bacterium]|nr:glycosyltransferase [Terriglobia bacterium]